MKSHISYDSKADIFCITRAMRKCSIKTHDIVIDLSLLHFVIEIILRITEERASSESIGNQIVWFFKNYISSSSLTSDVMIKNRRTTEYKSSTMFTQKRKY